MNDVLILDDSLILDYVALVVLPWLFFLNRIVVLLALLAVVSLC